MKRLYTALTFKLRVSAKLLLQTAIASLIITLMLSPDSLALNRLQQMINQAKRGSVIKLPKDIYYGSVVIKKPLTIDGGNRAIIDGEGKGNVITVKSDNVTIKNLIIQNSGDQGWEMDAGIAVKRANHIKIIHNVIKNCLYGIQTKYMNYSLIAENNISSKPYKQVGLRGDAIRLWWSSHDLLKDNFVHDSRDLIIWFCRHDTLINQTSIRSRYGIHFMYSNYDKVINYRGDHNMVGIYDMYTTNVEIDGALITNNTTVTSIGLGLKDASNLIAKNITVEHCTRGVFIDESPYEPGMYCKFINNRFYYNTIAMDFNTDITRNKNLFIHNDFVGNFKDIRVSGGMLDKKRGYWEKNYWDRYEGFDRNHDGIGDLPYYEMKYSGIIAEDNPSIMIFNGSPLFTFIKFIEKLVPFSQPSILLVDKKPLMHLFLPKLHVKGDN